MSKFTVIRFTIIIFALFSSSCIEQNNLSSNETTEKNEPACKLNINQSPKIRNLKLGMSLEEIKPILKGAKDFIPKDHYGVIRIGRTPEKMMPAWGENFDLDGVKSLYLELVDDKLALIRIVYNETDIWNGKEMAFAEKVSDQLKIPNTWEEGNARYDFESLKTFICKCEGFEVASYIIDIRITTRYPSIEINDSLALEKVYKRIEEEEKKDNIEKEKLEEDKRKNTKL